MNSTVTRSRSVRTAIFVGAVALLTLAGVLAVSQLRSDGSDDDDGVLTEDRYFGRLTAAYVAPDELLFDVAELLEGDAARDAALEDGVPPDEIVDFYVRNDDERAVTLRVSSAVVVTTVDCSGAGCVEGAPGDYGTLTRVIERSPGWYRLAVDDGMVVRIDEQYLP